MLHAMATFPCDGADYRGNGIEMQALTHFIDDF